MALGLGERCSVPTVSHFVYGRRCASPLFVAFWLELENPFWAGTSAAIVCQPQLGASLRKGWFRMIGTAVGATTIVGADRVLSAGSHCLSGASCLPGAVSCAFRRHGPFAIFASYSAALAGYTAAIICRR